MIDDTYKFTLTMKIMKTQREQMILDFTDKLDVTMMEGLQRFHHPAEYNIYKELYHVLWLDKHWNQLINAIEKDVQLEEDKLNLECYFSKCFLILVENYQVQDPNHSLIFYRILKVKAAALRDMIAIGKKCEQRCRELEYAKTKHTKEYQKLLAQLCERRKTRRILQSDHGKRHRSSVTGRGRQREIRLLSQSRK